MRKVRMISLLMCLFLLGSVANANELETISNDEDCLSIEFEDEAIDSLELEAVNDAINEDNSLLPENDFDNEYFDYTIDAVQSNSTFVDNYEDNDTMAKAYDYSRTEPVSTTIRAAGSLYSLGMRTGGLYSASDEDWFKARYSSGDRIFIDLRNIGKKNINIALYNSSGSEIWDSKKISKFNGCPEKYYNYYVPSTDTYYIKIYTLGDLPEPNYYFYFGLKENQKFNYRIQMEASTITPSTTISTGTTDFRNFFPRSASAINMTLTPYIITSSGLVRLQEMAVEINGQQYSTRDEDGRIPIGGADLYGRCSLEGRLQSGRCGIASWAPQAYGSFRCDMAPYPGNE
ncbi:hypothetical protein SAMN05421493_11717 [Pseudobutyrivibrio sp. 49]|uniref:hypothetical protein n=1 Tax=Pseudobutyrivibrio sp. 49 TaxID=1855344 RepID=UPI0008842FE9|nr:hypothetical protein [Pseudobutyrivibrio sp. 49]SDI52175.1 hypothetical protein SAMN05421493_11717 [Pseudobutyrivibrio sp. 49]